MTEAEIAKLSGWLAKAGLEGRAETALVEGFCSRAVAGGLPLAARDRVHRHAPPHPRGPGVSLGKEKPEATLTEYGRTAEGEAAERWRTSPLYRLLDERRIAAAPACERRAEAEFPSFAEFREAKFTDFVAIINRFAEDGVIGEMDCFYACWMTDRAGRFRRRRDRRAEASDAVPRARDQSRRRSAASPRPWSRPISGATPAGGC